MLVAVAFCCGTMLPRPALTAAVAGGQAFTPNDPGRSARRAGWADLQWNFVGHYGVGAPRAWENLRRAGRPGGHGVTVAVLDTGVAYPSGDPERPGSPELAGATFVPGYDFIDDDADPYDENGHGTHVASTIAEQTDNRAGLTGLAYGVRLMPVRVLDRAGNGDASTVARGIRFAVRHRAQVINLSLSFGAGIGAGQIPGLLRTLRYARQHGTLVVAGAGNRGHEGVAYPARGPDVLAVGATTEHGCLASYSNFGTGLDLVAPGGGSDARDPRDPTCRSPRRGRAIYQVTRIPSGTGPHFGITGFMGTSMAAPHVSAAAALVIASGVLGRAPRPSRIETRLERTARDLGRVGVDSRYGWGLVDAGLATTPRAATSRSWWDRVGSVLPLR